MNRKIKKELEAFREFKKTYQFTQKEIIEKDDVLYCDGEILKQGDAVTNVSEKWINAGYNLRGTHSKAVSNLFPYEFCFRGKKLNSIESFFQGIKFEDKKIQNLIFKYDGVAANCVKIATDYDWKKTGIIYWQGKPVDRNSAEYDELIDELYISAIQNPIYRGVLKNCDRPVIHSIGVESKSETVFTRYEFEYQINCLIAFLKNR